MFRFHKDLAKKSPQEVINTLRTYPHYPTIDYPEITRQRPLGPNYNKFHSHVQYEKMRKAERDPPPTKEKTIFFVPSSDSKQTFDTSKIDMAETKDSAQNLKSSPPESSSPYHSITSNYIKKYVLGRNNNHSSDDIDVVKEDSDIVKEDDDVVKEDGDIIKEDSDIVTEDGGIVKEDSDIIKEDGDVVKEDSDIIKEEGDVIKEDGNVVKEDDITSVMEAKVPIIPKIPERGTVDTEANKELLKNALSDLAKVQAKKAKKKKEPKYFEANRNADLTCLSPIEELPESDQEEEHEKEVCTSLAPPKMQAPHKIHSPPKMQAATKIHSPPKIQAPTKMQAPTKKKAAPKLKKSTITITIPEQDNPLRIPILEITDEDSPTDGTMTPTDEIDPYETAINAIKAIKNATCKEEEEEEEEEKPTEEKPTEEPPKVSTKKIQPSPKKKKKKALTYSRRRVVKKVRRCEGCNPTPRIPPYVAAPEPISYHLVLNKTGRIVIEFTEAPDDPSILQVKKLQLHSPSKRYPFLYRNRTKYGSVSRGRVRAATGNGNGQPSFKLSDIL